MLTFYPELRYIQEKDIHISRKCKRWNSQNRVINDEFEDALMSGNIDDVQN